MFKNDVIKDYSESVKKYVREKSIKYSIDLLTVKRKSISVVPFDYLRKCRQFLNQKNESLIQKIINSSFFVEAIQNWEKLWASHISRKKTKDITVAYLAGPNPLNDFDIFIKNGVLPENIWAFECDDDIFTKALDNIEKSIFNRIKINKIKIQDFFAVVPKTFDLIYIDACGALPSKKQSTLKIISSIFYHHRLSSPGILMTNFSSPIGNSEYSQENMKEHMMPYASLVSAYLYPKSFLEKIKNESNHNLDDGPVAYGFSCSTEINKIDEDFRREVFENFNDYYGQYITRQIFDLSSILIPFKRLCDSYDKTNARTLWSLLIDDNPTSLIKKSQKMKKFIKIDDSDDFITDPDYTLDSGGDFIVDPDMYPLGAFITNIEGYSDTDKNVKKLFTLWKTQISLNSNMKTDEVILIYEALKQFHSFQNDVLNALQNCNSNSVPFLCDIPTFLNLLYPILAQYTYPMHPNIKKIKRFTYKAKETQMFMDIIPFDECRYVYDYLPSSVLLNNIIDDKNSWFVYSLALDGIQKQLIRYMDVLFGCSMIGVNNKGFNESILQKRIKL